MFFRLSSRSRPSAAACWSRDSRDMARWSRGDITVKANFAKLDDAAKCSVPPAIVPMRIVRYTDAAYAEEIRRLNRRPEASEAVRDLVASVIAEVRQRGDAALVDFTKKFDGVN